MRLLCLAVLFSISSSFAMQRPVPKSERLPEEVPPPPVPAALEIPEDTRLFQNDPTAGGMAFSPVDGMIEAYAGFSVSFPVDVVAAHAIDQEGATSPIVAWPPLDGDFYWRSPSEGDWIVKGPRIPGQVYRLRLREGLTALDGSSLPVDSWGVELSSEPLAVSSWYDERDSLSARPLVPLHFTYPVRIHDVAEGIWFQNRATRERFPVDVRVDSVADESGLPAPMRIRVTPREPLPVNGRFDLVVDGVRDAYAGRGLPYPRVFPIGTTKNLSVDYVAARNWPTDKPHIEIKFRTPLAEGDLPDGVVTVTPPVENMRLRKDLQTVFLDGNFDTQTRYIVTIDSSLADDRGFALAADSVWGATFGSKPASILFPPGELRQRSALGLRFAFLQCNTGPLEWRLAKIPEGRLAATLAVLANEPKTGDSLLAEGLEVVAEGTFESVSSDSEELRRIEVKPPSVLAGPYLMEASASGVDGQRVANRTIIWFSEIALTQKLTPSELVVRAADMGRATPVPDAGVELLTSELLPIAKSGTDPHGIARFARSLASGASFIRTTNGEAITLSPASPGAQFPSGSTYSSPQSAMLGKILSDRPLYRPGQEIKIKGFIRDRTLGKLAVPTGREVVWEITKAWQNAILASGKVQVTSSGGWDAAFSIPESVDLGEYRIQAKWGVAEAGYPAFFRIEEFRNPPFSVICERGEATKAGESVVNVSSNYFHGAPNVGSRVKWKATWLSDHDGFYYGGEDGFEQVDILSPGAKAPVYEMVVEGETALDGKGQAVIEIEAPFPDPGNRAHADVLWQVDVTGPDGQTVTGGTTDRVTMNDLALGVREVEEPPAGVLRFEFRVIPRLAEAPVPSKIPSKLFLVKTKSVKEMLAPFVYRYRNTDDFIEVASVDAVPGAIADFPAKEPGRYVLVAGPVDGGIAVSAGATVAGPGEAEFPVLGDETLAVKAPREPVPVGEPVTVDVISPSAGIAWVTVETDRILDSRTIELPGNATKIEIPTLADFVPNAWVSVYMLRPGGDDAIPGELFGFDSFRVSDPEVALEVTPEVEKTAYEPREKIVGTVRVTSNGRPSSGAEVTVYAVDDAILELGGWTLPDLLPSFYPEQSFNVVTSPALRGLALGVSPDDLTQKGYTVGDGGAEAFGSVAFTRKDFKPLLFWKPSLSTNREGIVQFETVAPDNLTRFRVIALAQTSASQFGTASSTFEVSKSLLIEPALPRFLREGDEVELRAVARQKVSPEQSLQVRCVTDLSLVGEDSHTLSATKDAPAVVLFPAKVTDGVRSASVRFDVSSGAGHSDSVEVALPVLPRTITVDESVAGNRTGNTFAVGDFLPPIWAQAAGTFDLTLSTSEWLVKLMGVPSVLDYPHGCFEQQSARVLVFTALADLLKWLPTNTEHVENYRRAVTDTFEAMEASLLPDGQLPYWPMGTLGSPFVTIQSALAVAMAEDAAIEVPERLAEELATAMQEIVSRTLPTSPSLRAFAVFVLSEIGVASDLQVQELFLERDRLTPEAKAMLALAMHNMEVLPAEQAQLVAELPTDFSGQRFDPVMFSSATRSEAFCAMARLAVDPGVGGDQIARKLGVLMESSSSLSTQENLWLLVSFKAMLSGRPAGALPKALKPSPDSVSLNRAAAAWTDRDLQQAQNLQVEGLGAAKGTFVLRAKRQLLASEVTPVQRGIKLDRLVRNLTDPERAGSREAPFQLGDEVLITYRFQSQQAQSFLALDDALPACIEVLNPNLAMFGKFYQVPDESGVTTALLSHSELRDSRTVLYFDEVGRGMNSYSVLARATAAGTFSWPAAQISPMYDSRIYARTPPSECAVVSPK